MLKYITVFISLTIAHIPEQLPGQCDCNNKQKIGRFNPSKLDPDTLYQIYKHTLRRFVHPNGKMYY